jgi:hypothetical protein
MIAVAAPAAPSPDQQQLNAMSLDLNAVRQSVDRIAASQEQITRSVYRIAASQEQITGEITKLREIEQYILYKNSESPLPLAPARRAAARRGRRRHQLRPLPLEILDNAALAKGP